MFLRSARRSAIRQTGRLSHSTAARPTSPSSPARFENRPLATRSVVVRGPRSSKGRVLGGANGIGPYYHYEVDGSLGGVVGRLSSGNPSTVGEFPAGLQVLFGHLGSPITPPIRDVPIGFFFRDHTSLHFSISTNEPHLLVQHSSESAPSRPRRPSRRSSRPTTLTINTRLGARIGRTG